MLKKDSITKFKFSNRKLCFCLCAFFFRLWKLLSYFDRDLPRENRIKKNPITSLPQAQTCRLQGSVSLCKMSVVALLGSCKMEGGQQVHIRGWNICISKAVCSHPGRAYPQGVTHGKIQALGFFVVQCSFTSSVHYLGDWKQVRLTDITDILIWLL